MVLRFFAKGHPLLRMTHKSTFEITKEDSLTSQGDCIVAIAADVDMRTVSAFLRSHDRFELVLTCGKEKMVVEGQSNPDFRDDVELVFRTGGFLSSRTAGIFCTASAQLFPREFLRAAQTGTSIEVILR